MDFAETHETIIKVVTILGVLGIPSIFTMAVWCIKACKNFAESLNFISSAIKSQIRNDLIKDYDAYTTRGWCSTVEQTEWINRYNNYHNLYGENGVLDNKYTIITNMPNAPKTDGKSKGGC